jgi:nitroreductase
MDILPEILARRSCRTFKGKSVEKSKLDRILKAGQLAPSAKNRQEWRFVVTQNPSLRKKIQEAAFGQEYVGGAPVIIAMCTTNIGYRMPNGQLSYPIDIAFAASSMVMQATREQLGSCIVTTFDEQEIKDLLSVPYAMKVVLLILIGYAGKVAEPTSRKPLKRIISYDHW